MNDEMIYTFYKINKQCLFCIHKTDQQRYINRLNTTGISAELSYPNLIRVRKRVIEKDFEFDSEYKLHCEDCRFSLRDNNYEEDG